LRWIAWRNFGGYIVGPQPLGWRAVAGPNPGPDEMGLSREEFAVELLLDRAARGRIRIYSWQHRLGRH
jgi:hypothetical protein